MPLSPTDPRMFGDIDLPQPPTTDAVVPQPAVAISDARPRYVPVSPGEGGGQRMASERPFGRQHVPPTTSPYLPVYNNTTGRGRNTRVPLTVAADAAGNDAYDKPFDHYNPPPATSPYLLLNSNTANGTISTYNAYVRPALAHQGNQNSEEPLSGQGSPSYPSVFLTQGQYTPSLPAAR